MIAGASCGMGDLSLLWWLVPVFVAAAAAGFGAFAVLKLIGKVVRPWR